MIRQALDSGAYARADELATRSVAQRESQRPSDSSALLRARDLLVEARVLSGKGGDARTLSLATRMVRLKEQRFGLTHVETGHALHNAGLVRTARGEFSVAIPLFERALAILTGRPRQRESPRHRDARQTRVRPDSTRAIHGRQAATR